jgi:hypothetical protein
MEKKILTWYETPEVEIIEAEVDAQLLAGSTTTGGSEDVDPEDVDPGFGS